MTPVMLLLDLGAVAASAIVAASGAATITAASTSGFSTAVLPPLDAYDVLLAKKCALRAQQARNYRSQSRDNASAEAAESRQPAWTLVGGSPLVSDANESYLNGIPVNQARYESARRRGELFCRSGSWLEISDTPSEESSPFDRQEHKNASRLDAHQLVRGIRIESSRYAVLDFLAVAFGLLSIRGVASRNFLCMDGRGELYAANESSYSAECIFMEEMLENYYNLYSSCAYGTHERPWYVALQRSGHARRGRNTKKKQKSSHFLVTYFADDASGAKSAEDDYKDYDYAPETATSSERRRRRLRRRKSGSEALFASYSHSATRVLPQLLIPVGGDSKRWKTYYELPRLSSDASESAAHLQTHNNALHTQYKPLKQQVSANTEDNAAGNHYGYAVQIDVLQNRNVNRTHLHYREEDADTVPIDAYFPMSIFRDNSVNASKANFARQRRLLREERRRLRRKNELKRLRKLIGVALSTATPLR